MKLSGLLAVFFFLCTDRTGFGTFHLKPACHYPPSQWCRSLEIAIECKVQKQCMEVNATRLNQAVSPVSVTLYYESLCPACSLHLPAALSHLDVILLSANSPFTCQHGEPECRGNMIEACIIHLSGHSAFHIIYCMESAADVLNAAEPCLQLYAPSVSWSSVDSCVKGGLGYQLMHANAVITRALNPAHTHIPWVTFNGKYKEENEDKAMSSLPHLVCHLYKGVKPPACTGASVRLDRNIC
uniref:Gamma-interferon-inducible lysosomal thiol reductase n=1 Tax=Mastacembelus armatus TaxID=205130 RepID=A0A7N8XFP8_9TELE